MNKEKLFRELMDSRRALRKAREERDSTQAELNAIKHRLSAGELVQVPRKLVPELRSQLNTLKRSNADLVYQRDNLHNSLAKARKEINKLRSTQAVPQGPRAWPE